MLKFLFLILLLGLVFFLLGVKHSRPAQPRKEAPEPKPTAAPQDMVSCAQCGLHLPAEEALPGRGGLFCSALHRQAYEAEHGGGA
ncbi:uncharacterized protein HNP55_003852 [Paucibacter oligotrophus]|uniref:Uncharacterized protein n=1 Tax=Roseateles oligotrophus TaxID=1769250 RepID=A0A840LE99_9BURK|nr:PP0621 family protein [Roseateles oligotrophus]MBB4845305.1 uncharacterized protein [Roseateles oligotrophus]